MMLKPIENNVPVDLKMPRQNPVPYLALAGVWLIAMLWCFFSLTSPLSNLDELSSDNGVSPGESGSFYLDPGEHGIWVTSSQNFKIDSYQTGNDAKAVEVVDPDGKKVPLVSVTTESLVLGNEDSETYLYRVIRVPTPGMYTIISNLPSDDNSKVNFGRIWTSGELINPTSGGIVLGIGWLVSVGCAIAALRISHSRRQQIQKYISENNEPTDT